MPDMQLRLVSETPEFPLSQVLYSPSYTWIVTSPEGKITSPSYRDDRRRALAALLASRSKRASLVIVWPGQYRSDAFLVDTKDAMRAITT